jgi:hypothetical protein
MDRAVSAADPPPLPTVNLRFLDRSRYIFYQVAPPISSRGWAGPVPEPLLLRKSRRAGNRNLDLCDCNQKLTTRPHRRLINTGTILRALPSRPFYFTVPLCLGQQEVHFYLCLRAITIINASQEGARHEKFGIEISQTSWTPWRMCCLCGSSWKYDVIAKPWGYIRENLWRQKEYKEHHYHRF